MRLDNRYISAIWDQQGRPVEGIIVPTSGHATAYVERFVHVILRKLGPFALRIGEKLSLVYIPFGVRFMCIVYIAYMGTVGKLYTFCTLC